MRTKLINSSEDNHSGYGAGSGDTERYEYECSIVEEHDNIPGFRDHSVFVCCDECRNNYELDTSKGVRGWELIKK